MINYDEIIKAVKCCVSDPEGRRACSKCPYRDVAISGGHCQNRMHNDVIAALEYARAEEDSGECKSCEL